MGFIVIIPLAALAGWSIFAIFRWLRGGGFGQKWWRAFVGLGTVGMIAGIYFAFAVQYKVANARIEGFPIPVGISNRQTPADPWVKSEMPEAIHLAGLITDFLSGVALCLAPVAIAAFFKENKSKNIFNFPRPDPPA